MPFSKIISMINENKLSLTDQDDLSDTDKWSCMVAWKNHDSWQKGLFDYDTRSIIGHLEGYLPIIKPNINSNIHGHSWHIRKIYTDPIDLLRCFTYRNNSCSSANKHTCILTSQVYQRTSITQYKTWLVMPLTELYSSSLQYFHWLIN